jgi:hypothetical protein
MLFAAFALCLGLGLIAAGCGASGPLTPIEPGTSEDPLAESTVSSLTECAKAWPGDLKAPSYKLRFNVTVNKHGGVSDVHPEGSGLDGSDVEKCMIGALRNMSVPPFVYRRMSSERASQRVSGGALTPESRALAGNVLVAAGVVVELVPIVITAAGVTIIVAIAIDLVSEMAKPKDMADEEYERCQKVYEACYVKCSSAGGRSKYYGSFDLCMKECKDAEGCWGRTR